MQRIKVLPMLMAAVLVAAALVAPASAFAVEWKHGGKGLTESVTIEIDGHFEIAYLGNGVNCPVHAKATLFPGDKGEITELDVDGTPGLGTCVAFGANLEGCIVTGTGNVPLSIQAQANGSVLIKKQLSPLGSQIFTWNFTKSEKPGTKCTLAGDYWKVKGNITGTPDNRYEIHSLTINQTVEVESKSGKFFTGLLGESLALTPSGYYGIE